MRFGKRGPRSSDVRRREAYHPATEDLEDRVMLTVDLGGVVPPAVPNVATPVPNLKPPGPFGIQEAGKFGGVVGGGLGYSTALLGDVFGQSFESALVGEPQVNLDAHQFENFPARYGNGRAYLVLGSQTVTAGPTPWLGLAKDATRVGFISGLGTTPQTSPVGAANSPSNAFDGVTFITSKSNDGLGFSVADAGQVNPATDQLDDFLIGAPGIDTAFLVLGSRQFPNLTSNPAELNNQAFVLDAPQVPPSVVRVITITGPGGSHLGQTVSGLPNVLGSVDVSQTPPTADQSNLAIAAPDVLNADGSIGAVYVVSSSSLLANATANGDKVNNLDALVTSGAITGVKITLAFPSQIISISAAGDVDNDGHPDFLIGTPGNFVPLTNLNPPGAAYLIYGHANGDPFTPPANLNTFSLTDVGQTVATDPGFVAGATFKGGPGYRTGYTVGVAGRIGAGFSEILIGSPAAANDHGEVTLIYGGLKADGTLIPGSPARLYGTFQIDAPQQYTSATFTGDVNKALPQTQQPLAGFGLSSTFTDSTQQSVYILIGAPGVEPLPPQTGSTIGQGAVYVITVPANNGDINNLPFVGPQSLDITTFEKNLKGTLIIDTNGAAAAAQPDINLGASLSGILPLTIPVPGSIPGNTIDGDSSGDFLIGAPLDSTGDTIAGLTTSRAGSLFAIEGAFLTNVNGGSTGGGSGGPLPLGTTTNISGRFYPLVAATTSFGNDRFVPAPSALSRLNYKAIPLRVAYRQYLPDTSFTQRTLNYFYPGKYHFQPKRSSDHHTKPHGVTTLGTSVFTRSQFKPGHTLEFTHPVPVVPANRQTEKLGGGALPKQG